MPLLSLHFHYYICVCKNCLLCPKFETDAHRVECKQFLLQFLACLCFAMLSFLQTKFPQHGLHYFRPGFYRIKDTANKSQFSFFYYIITYLTLVFTKLNLLNKQTTNNVTLAQALIKQDQQIPFFPVCISVLIRSTVYTRPVSGHL